MTSGCCICVTVAVDIPTHTSMKVQILYPALGIQIRASQGSLDTRDLHVFACSNLNQLRYFLLSTILYFASFSTDNIITYLNVYSRVLYTFLPFLGFLFENHHGPSVDIYQDVRGCNNSTCIQLYLPFNFVAVPLIDCVLFKVL